MDVYAELTKRGIVRAVCHFSGGNDEGGVDSIDFYDKNEQAVEIETHTAAKAPHWFDEDKQKWVEPEGFVVYTGEYHEPEPGKKWRRPKTRPATAEEIEWTELWRALGQPVYDRYGSFAGDFSVYGEVVYDVEERSATFSGAERSEYQSFEERL